MKIGENCPRCKKRHLTEDRFCEHCLYQEIPNEIQEMYMYWDW